MIHTILLLTQERSTAHQWCHFAWTFQTELINEQAMSQQPVWKNRSNIWAVTHEAAWGPCWQNDLKPVKCVRHVIYWHCHIAPREKVNKCMFILTPQSCSAQTFYRALMSTRHWKTVVFIKSAWFLSKQACFWVSEGHSLSNKLCPFSLHVKWEWASSWWPDSVLAVSSAAWRQQGEASMVTEAKRTQPQL